MKKIFCCSLLYAFFIVCVGAQIQTAPDLYKKGQAFQAREDWFSAIECYQEALRLNPSFGDVWFALAQCSYASAQYDLTQTYLDAAEKYIQNNTAVPDLRGFALIAQGKLEEARVQFLQVLSDYPNDINARFGLAELDIFLGKFSGAQNYYLDALRREGTNRRALLSLALVSDELGKVDEAREFIKQAIAFHSGSPEVHYFAGYLSAKEGDLKNAEGFLRSAIMLKGDYIDAYTLLAGVLYATKRYDEVIDICDYIISRDRNSPALWYLKGLSYKQNGFIEKAIASLQIGISIDSTDEIMRAALELIMIESLSIEDERRKILSDYHAQKAQRYYEKFYGSQARFEFMSALRLDPENTEARLAFADILLRDGYKESYLEQLKFVQSQGNGGILVDDAVEAWDSVLQESLAKEWRVNPLYLDKNRFTLAVYSQRDSVRLQHQMIGEIGTRMLSLSLSSNPIFTVKTGIEDGYAASFKSARTAGADYFFIVSFDEMQRALSMETTMYSALSGNKIAHWSFYKSGNDKFALSIEKTASAITTIVPKFGHIIDRNTNEILLDIGRRDGAFIDQTYFILKRGSLKQTLVDENLSWDEKDILGEVTLKRVNEEISSGFIKQKGYYDLIHIGDDIILKPEEEKESPSIKIDSSSSSSIEKKSSALYELVHSLNP